MQFEESAKDLRLSNSTFEADNCRREERTKGFQDEEIPRKQIV